MKKINISLIKHSTQNTPENYHNFLNINMYNIDEKNGIPSIIVPFVPIINEKKDDGVECIDYGWVKLT